MSALPSEKSLRKAKKTVVVRKKEKIPRGINRHGRPKKKPGRHMSPEQLAEAHKKQEQALELRMSGITYNEIAKALGYSGPGAAKNAVDAVINRTEKEAATEVVALDLARLDEYQMRCTHALRNNGDLHQIDRLMRIMEMRYRLLGISDETVRAMQENHGIVVNNKNMVMNIHAAPETEDEFIRKMMLAVGADPDSPQAKKILSEHDVPLALPMLEGSANESRTGEGEELGDEEIVDGEIVEDE
jgi:hypothetical protein